MNKISKKLWAAAGGAALLAAAVLPALAADTAGVTATVTPGIISVSVSPGAVAYGTVNIPSVDNVPSPDSIIGATNNGGIPEDFTIRGADATPGGGGSKTWKITTGSPSGSLDYFYNHKFLDCGSDSGCSAPPAANLMDTTPEALATSVAISGTEYFKLRLSTPTETGGDLTTHSTTVTVQATAH